MLGTSQVSRFACCSVSHRPSHPRLRQVQPPGTPRLLLGEAGKWSLGCDKSDFGPTKLGICRPRVAPVAGCAPEEDDRPAVGVAELGGGRPRVVYAVLCAVATGAGV